MGGRLASPKRVGDKLQVSVLNAQQKPLANAQISVLVDHPVGRTEPFNLTLSETAPGHYVSNETIPAGRWKLKISVTEGGRNLDLLGEIK